jgi:hypothetical protein
MPGERTSAAIRRDTIERQLEAMGAPRYVVGVHHRAEDRMYRLANISAGQVLAHEREFAGLNVRGRDIYIAPVRNSGLILIDDLPIDTLVRLRQDGLSPAVAVETSPANYQVWLRLAPEELPRELATAVSRELALRYGGDRGSVGAEHLGRLAGYSNQKPSRTLPDGRHPWVRLQEAEGRQAPMAERLLDKMRTRLVAERHIGPNSGTSANERLSWEHLDTRPAREGASGIQLRPEYLAQEFAMRAARILERQRERGDRPDYSAADWAVVGTMHERYPWLSTALVAQAMRMGSPNLEERHRGHVADYVGRTVVKAVRAQQEHHAREGPGRPAFDRATRQEVQARSR